jgi:2-dehydro-3-deoxyphosphooctonate aldolase (KDO 8-P synthase)
MAKPVHPSVEDLFGRRRLVLIAGPCVIESFELCAEVAAAVKEIASRHGLGFVFKASFDKANRTSITSFRGPGLAAGLETLGRVRQAHDIAVLTDIHLPDQAAAAAQVVDVLQIPAFLCRQTDLLLAAARTGLPTNIKKGQFLAPEDMVHAVTKHQQGGGGPVSVTERGSSFGYHNLVVDMRGLAVLAEATQAAVVFDATHSVQRPSAGDGITSGHRRLAPVLARAPAAVGIDGLFCEVHPNPDAAKSDAANSLSFELLDSMLGQVCAIDAAVRDRRH